MYHCVISTSVEIRCRLVRVTQQSQDTSGQHYMHDTPQHYSDGGYCRYCNWANLFLGLAGKPKRPPDNQPAERVAERDSSLGLDYVVV